MWNLNGGLSILNIYNCGEIMHKLWTHRGRCAHRDTKRPGVLITQCFLEGGDKNPSRGLRVEVLNNLVTFPLSVGTDLTQISQMIIPDSSLPRLSPILRVDVKRCLSPPDLYAICQRPCSFQGLLGIELMFMVTCTLYGRHFTTKS